VHLSGDAFREQMSKPFFRTPAQLFADWQDPSQPQQQQQQQQSQDHEQQQQQHGRPLKRPKESEELSQLTQEEIDAIVDFT
jgi:hypothetical protein